MIFEAPAEDIGLGWDKTINNEEKN